jgi:hypothetical protein
MPPSTFGRHNDGGPVGTALGGRESRGEAQHVIGSRGCGDQSCGGPRGGLPIDRDVPDDVGPSHSRSPDRHRRRADASSCSSIRGWSANACSRTAARSGWCPWVEWGVESCYARRSWAPDRSSGTRVGFDRSVGTSGHHCSRKALSQLPGPQIRPHRAFQEVEARRAGIEHSTPCALCRESE